MTYNTYTAKLKHIFPTYLIIVSTTVIGLALFRWVFTIHFNVITLKESAWEFWLPLIFPWLPITFWLRQKLRILTFKGDNYNGRFLFQFIVWISMGGMLILSQTLITTASGKLLTINKVSEIKEKEKVRYYRIETIIAAPFYGGVYTHFNTSGKHNNYFNFNIYFVTPLLSDTILNFSTLPKYWYAVKFHEQISNRLTPEEKEEKYRAFYNESLSKMNAYNFTEQDHFERTPYSDDLEYYLKAVEARINQKPDDSFVILKPIKEPYETRNGNKFAWIFGVFGIGTFIFLFSLIWPGYSRTEHERQLKGIKPKKDDLVEMLKYLIPKGDHFATSIILDLNILVFLLMLFSGINMMAPNGLELLEWGANRRQETAGGEWWRLLTSMFLHGGVMHLALNIFGLILAAIFIEPLLGRNKYLLLYLLSGLVASLASIWWYENTISIGASGAIFGLYGGILGLLLTKAIPNEQKLFTFLLIGLQAGLSLVMGLVGGIDNAAHIGGLISGFIIGILLYKIDN